MGDSQSCVPREHSLEVLHVTVRAHVCLSPHSQAIAKRYISFRSPGLILGKMICIMAEMHILTEKFQIVSHMQKESHHYS